MYCACVVQHIVVLVKCEIYVVVTCEIRKLRERERERERERVQVSAADCVSVLIVYNSNRSSLVYSELS